MTSLPERLRDEVLHIIALGRGRHDWHAIASRLSSKDVPRAPGLGDVLRQLREDGLATMQEGEDGHPRWQLTEDGRAVLSARASPPTSGVLAQRAQHVADLLFGDAEALPEDPCASESEPTPDERAWLELLLDDARFVLEASPISPPASPAQASDDAASLKDALEHARATGQWRGLLESLRRVPGLRPGTAIYFRGRAWHALGFHSLAAAMYQRALRLEPHHSLIGVQWLNALADAGDGERLTSAIERIRRDPSSRLELALTAETVAYRALLAERDAMARSRAEAIARRISELFAEPESAEILPSIAASGAVAAALCLDALGLETQARRFAVRATQLMPDSGPTWLVRGLIGHRHGSSRTEEHLRRAARLMPAFVWPCAYLAHLALVDERFEECLRWCEAALPLARTDAVRAALYEWRGLSRAATGARREARADLRRAATLDPSQPSYRANLAAFEGASDPHYELHVSEALRTETARAVSFAPLVELAA